MTRRITLLFVFLLLCVSSAWPKFSDDDKKYLDDQFRSVQDQIQAMQNQIQTLNTELQRSKENQAQLQAVIIRQQQALKEINQMVSTMSMDGQEHYSKLKALIDKLSSQITKTPLEPERLTTNPPPPVKAAPVTGYVTSVEGNNVLIDVGAAQGIQQGTRLVLYKATDPDTRVGVLEVTQVQDSGSRARIISVINSGVKPAFGDIVRLEQ